MKLQLALDTLSIEESLALLANTAPFLDIIEIGTPFLLKEGVKALKEIKAAYPDKLYFADAKIADGAAIETAMMIEAGADIISVLALSGEETIRAAVETAHKAHKLILADFLAVDDIAHKAQRLVELGVDILCVHTSFDTQLSSHAESPLAELIRLQEAVPNGKTAIAGGVKLSNLKEILKQQPDIIVVGGGITSQADPCLAAKTMKELIIHYENC